MSATDDFTRTDDADDGDCCAWLAITSENRRFALARAVEWHKTHPPANGMVAEVMARQSGIASPVDQIITTARKFDAFLNAEDEDEEVALEAANDNAVN